MMRILIASDYSPRWRVAQMIREGREDEVFSEVKGLTSVMDYSVVNFESTVMDGSDKPIKKSGPNLGCSAESLPAIRNAGFDMVTLANNHFADYGDSAVQKSFEAINSAGLDHVGGGRNIHEATKPLLKEIKGKTIAFINCCEHEFSIADEKHGGCNPLNPIQQYYQIKEVRDKSDYVIVIVHGGHEYFQLPSLRMQETYRFFIDAGADVVINHHQHCYSGYEVWRGKPIFYGLGNFCFDYEEPKPEVWYEGFALELDIDDNEIGFKLHPYIQCKDEPKVSFLKNRNDFDKDIKRLNDIIADSDKLKSVVDAYYNESADGIINSFTMHKRFAHRFPRLNDKLFPSYVKRRSYDFRNMVVCESHTDKFRYAMMKLTPVKRD